MYFILTTFAKAMTKKDRKIMNKCFNVYTEINMNTWIITWLKIWSQILVQKCMKYNVYEYKKVLNVSAIVFSKYLVDTPATCL